MAEYESHSDFSDAESISQTDSLVQRAGIKITPRAGRVTRAGQTGLAGSGTKKTAKSKEKDSRTEQPVQAVVQSAKKRKSNGDEQNHAQRNDSPPRARSPLHSSTRTTPQQSHDAQRNDSPPRARSPLHSSTRTTPQQSHDAQRNDSPPRARSPLHSSTRTTPQQSHVPSSISRASSCSPTPVQRERLSTPASSSRANSLRASPLHDLDEEESFLSIYQQQSRTIEKMCRTMNDLKKGQDTIIEMMRQSNGPVPKKQKADIPNYVRTAVHDGYKAGVDDEHGLQWQFSRANSEIKLKFSSPCNERLTQYIQTFVLGLYGQVDVGVIREAIQRYYISMKELQQRQESGRAERHKKKMAGVERRRRKLMRRQGALRKKASYTDEEMKKVEKILTVDFMSSEEEVESEGEELFLIKKLPWRSQEADSYMRQLDSKARQLETPRGKRQRLKRVRGGEDSSRPLPSSLDHSQQWAVSED